ncbi:MAG TPA: sigma-54 dependent transcriptional regulator [Smithella sp.]|jgi:DNA-binding NtrC family response regulator|nr:sigma-54-dependent Fis family transcriptional regulator [Smithella sp.]OQC53388.1 MAG: Transcriptional regulatory protein ZraR [Deltaproteobacteria bacterium ADurb.Bin022]HNQ65567.1 sigma-54 dependent transcriptional regulator [Smithella sp.]HOE32974.1 sigma-54 dependent transcriptional regulator [Smithella sp.]HOG09056.1 sigma-54 dependent transcriptional regulator [Smithella sp.]
MKKRILVVDDDAVACEFLEETLKRDGYDVTLCSSAWEALRQNIASYNLVMSDIRMSGMDGLQLLEELQKQSPDLPVILMTAYGSLETTMAAVNKGAWDYISKPFSPEDCRTLVRKVLELRKLRHKGMKLQPAKVEESKFIGSSAMMVDFYKQIARIADSSASVLIEGESGTGKELTARSLHNMSSRREKPFIIVHCGAIPDNLLESELFGYNKGAYTGASHQHTGLLETAEGGTVFLDEITEMSTALQGKFLRFMQNGELRKIGDNAVRNVEVRVVAAANKKIDDEVKKENFRLDLLYRFIVRLRIPPLREHKEDIPLLTEALLKKLGDTNVSVSPDAMEMFMAYDWPGNVRELENVLQQIMLLSPFDEILPENLPERFHSSTDRKDILNGPGLSPLEEAEKEKILQTLKETSWNQSQAAKRLDIDRKTLRTKIRRYSLS